tara:strand:+ start:259 stop:441 length:183 start_codon:yes stop_codon:yes gene_type:complete
MIPPMGKTDFMIDTETMTAHFWAEYTQDMMVMLMMQSHDLKLGGFSIEQTVSDIKPSIFD